MAKWNARAFVTVTIDFEIEADDPDQAESRVEEYLKHIQGGKPAGQTLSVKVQEGDENTGIFIMEAEVEDVYELDTV